jgi:hypothetical protein
VTLTRSVLHEPEPHRRALRTTRVDDERVRLAASDPNIKYAEADLGLTVFSNGWSLQFSTPLLDGGYVQESPLPLQSLPLDQWGHFALDLTFPSGGDGGAVAASVNDASSRGPLLTPDVSPKQTLTMGIFVVDPPSGPWAIRFDNVFCDAK